MRSFSKFAALVAVLVGLFAAPAAAQTGPSTSWNNGRTVQYKATAIGKPPHGVAHRVSVTDADFYSLSRVGDAETYAIDAADADFGLASLFPAGNTLHSVGTDWSHPIGSNVNGTIWDATVYAYVKSGPFSGTACKFDRPPRNLAPELSWRKGRRSGGFYLSTALRRRRRVPPESVLILIILNVVGFW